MHVFFSFRIVDVSLHVRVLTEFSTQGLNVNLTDIFDQDLLWTKLHSKRMELGPIWVMVNNTDGTRSTYTDLKYY